MISVLTFAATGFSALPALRFAHSLGDHMVLQQAPKQAIVWGICDPAKCADVHVTLAAAAATDNLSSTVATSVTIAATAGTVPGTFLVKLPATAGGATAHTVTATDGTSTAILTDVLFGDVWVCSGQSNMAFLLANAFNGSTFVADSIKYPTLRMFTSKKTNSKQPLDEQPVIEQAWAVSSPSATNMPKDDGNSSSRMTPHFGDGSGDDNWLYMSAVCYLFGVEILKHTGKPVGLVNTNWGGTPVEDWMSVEAEAACPSPGAAGGAYNGMIKPLLNMTIYGAIWYQGESNQGDPITTVDHQGLPLARYGCRFPAMVADWRAKWSEGTMGATDPLFPFGYVQLAAWINANNAPAGIRWAQSGGFPSVPNAKMPNVFNAIAIDLLDRTSPYGSVHIRDKLAVGQRLAAGGIAVAYKDADTYWGGPTVESAVLVSDATLTVTVSFDNVGATGLEIRNKTGFEVCRYAHEPTPSNETQCDQTIPAVPGDAPNTNGHWTAAAIVSSTAKTVTVGMPTAGPASTKKGLKVLVRYAWKAAPFEFGEATVYAKAENYPAGGFVVAAT